MKSKKLLISLAAVALVIVFIVVMIAVFAVKTVEPQYHDFAGNPIAAPTDGTGIIPDDVLSLIKGKSTVFLSETDLISKINQTYGNWHAFAVVKKFPNIVVVHFAERTTIAKINIGGHEYFIDSFGYVVNESADTCVDITSAFDSFDTQQCAENFPLIFHDEENNIRLKCVLDAILAVWRCKVEVSNIPQILGEQNVFKFDDGNMIIKMPKGVEIRVIAPESNLSDRLIQAYSVYYNNTQNLRDGDVIIVHKNGSITSPDKK